MRDDEIRVTVPPDADMVHVVVAAVTAVVRRSGLGEASLAEAREEAAAAFEEVLEGGTGDVVTLTAGAERHRYAFELERDGASPARREHS